MNVAVFRDPVGAVYVMYPRYPLSEEEVRRLAEQDGLKSPLTQGLPFEIIDSSQLPPRVGMDSQGDPYSVRNAWTSTGSGVTIDPTRLEPALTHLLDRMTTLIPPERWPAGVYADLRQSIMERDLPAVRAACVRLRNASLPEDAALVTDTLSVKRIP